jgi:antitoxin (DNA-binding transcriptional repressor) of toxin-antitoxin stability system
MMLTMTTKALGISDARQILGDLVLAAKEHGTVTAITRNGRSAALIVPGTRKGVMEFVVGCLGNYYENLYDELTYDERRAVGEAREALDCVAGQLEPAD